MLRALRSLIGLLPAERRRQLGATMLLMLLGAAAEMVTIGAALPFLALISDPETSLVPQWLRRFLMMGGITPVAGAAMLLAVSALAAAAVRLALARTSQRFVMSVGHDIAALVFSGVLRQPYSVHVQRNSSETLAAVDKVQSVVFGVLNPGMQGLLASVIALFVVLLLLWINSIAAGIAAFFVAIVYTIVTLVTRPWLRRNSVEHASTIGERARTIQEGLGGIRDIILDRSEPLFEAKFSALDRRYRLAQARSQFIAIAPRFVIEAAGLVALAIVTVVMSYRPGGIVEAIPVLGALALGAQRLLPLIQQAYHGWSQMTGNYRAFLDVVEILQAPPPLPSDTPQPLPLERDIVFDGVGFRYEGGSFALRDVRLRIAAGEHVGIEGVTGSGKSTLLDLLMGLLEPTQGRILVDGRPIDADTRRAWQASLAHVPQAVYLADDSIAANIVFPRAPEEADEARLAEAVRAAQLEAFVAELPEGLATRVGERGVRLSGGQRQRIGLARALYRQPRLLILDEATSALDQATEAAVLASLHRLRAGLTLVTVAHRASTLAACDRVIRVDGGTVRQG
jgi:ATP-binding cassette subfamily B protein